MAAPDPHHRTQEQSIKARKHQLFEADTAEESLGGPRRSFADCLRETPATPLSPALRAALWVVGTLVIIILLAALTRSGTRKRPAAPAPAATLAVPARRLA